MQEMIQEILKRLEDLKAGQAELRRDVETLITGVQAINERLNTELPDILRAITHSHEINLEARTQLTRRVAALERNAG